MTAPTRSSHGIVIALPPMSTTIAGVPVAATRWISSSCRPGSPSSARSRNSPSSTPATIDRDVARSRGRHSSRNRRLAPVVARRPRPTTSFTRALPVVSKYLEPHRVRSTPGRSVTSTARVPYDRLRQSSMTSCAVEIQPVAVVALDADPSHAARRRDDGPCPAHREPVERDAAAGRVQRPIESRRPDPCA